MNRQLEDLLLTHLGELMHKRDSKAAWNERDEVTRKINAVYILLGIDKRDKTTMERVKEAMFY